MISNADKGVCYYDTEKKFSFIKCIDLGFSVKYNLIYLL